MPISTGRQRDLEVGLRPFSDTRRLELTAPKQSLARASRQRPRGKLAPGCSQCGPPLHELQRQHHQVHGAVTPGQGHCAGCCRAGGSAHVGDSRSAARTCEVSSLRARKRFALQFAGCQCASWSLLRRFARPARPQDWRAVPQIHRSSGAVARWRATSRAAR